MRRAQPTFDAGLTLESAVTRSRVSTRYGRHRALPGARLRLRRKEGEMIAVVVMFFVVAVVVLAVYGLLRPFTHFSYRHLDEQRWKPLD